MSAQRTQTNTLLLPDTVPPTIVLHPAYLLILTCIPPNFCLNWSTGNGWFGVEANFLVDHACLALSGAGFYIQFQPVAS